MADKIPVKAIPASGDATALQEFEAGDTNGIAHGGTGKTTIAADKFWYASALDTLSEASITTAGLAILDDADAAAQRTTLGLGTAAVQNTGTSGANVPLLSTANAWTLIQDFSASGAYFGTAAAANLLNDFEQGSWTPVPADAASAGNTGTYTTSLGRYVKIGNLVVVFFDISGIDTTGLTATNDFYLQGLPFVSSATNARGIGAVTAAFYTAAANAIDLTPRMGVSIAAIPFRETLSTGAASPTLKVSQLTSGSANLYGIALYTVD